MLSAEPERHDALPVGTVLRDFTIQSVIGHGGFGVVYRAGHNELDLTVAIKEFLPVELAVREGATVRPRSGTVRRDFEDGLRRFRDEAQVLVGFDSHPSIVSCRDFFRENGTAYLVMAYEDGRSLAEVLALREAEGRPFTEGDLLAVMLPLLGGLSRVHAAGVLHRDIKPSNVLIRRLDERPVLIDFGAAKQATARITKSLAPYTEGYAALEQVADAGKLGPWTDMYGVGAVMWRIVAGGNRPWDPPHPVRVERRSHAVVGATEDPLPSARELGKGRFQPHLLEAIDRCLRLREAERVQGSLELLEDIKVAGDRESPLEAGKQATAPDPMCAVSDRRQADVKGEIGSEIEDHGRLRLNRSRGGIEQPWIRDWDALEDIQDPSLAEPARAYIVRYGRVPEARVWVVKAEGLLAKLKELESSDRPQRTAGESWMNSLGMKFTWVPAGDFLMGSPSDEEDRDPDERQHRVWISEGFWMKTYPVTQEEWEAVMGENPSYFKKCGPRCPVEQVSWDEAQDYIRKVNGREAGRGYQYRLPTEAEWEYAARARTIGPRYGKLNKVAWYWGNSRVAWRWGNRARQPHRVGQRQANGWGLHDILGNVWEWTADWYGRYPAGPVTDPSGPGTGSHRVVRGGGWDYDARGVRSAYRLYYSPGARGSALGFRLVRTE